MRPSSRAREATAFSRAGAGFAPTDEPTRPIPAFRPGRPTTANPQDRELNERYRHQGPGRQDVAHVAQDAEPEAPDGAEHRAPKFLPRSVQGGRGGDGEASRAGVRPGAGPGSGAS